MNRAATRCTSNRRRLRGARAMAITSTKVHA